MLLKRSLLIYDYRLPSFLNSRKFKTVRIKNYRVKQHSQFYILNSACTEMTANRENSVNPL